VLLEIFVLVNEQACAPIKGLDCVNNKCRKCPGAGVFCKDVLKIAQATNKQYFKRTEGLTQTELAHKSVSYVPFLISLLFTFIFYNVSEEHLSNIISKLNSFRKIMLIIIQCFLALSTLVLIYTNIS